MTHQQTRASGVGLKNAPDQGDKSPIKNRAEKLNVLPSFFSSLCSDKGLLSPTVASASPLPAAPKTTSQAKVEFSVPLLVAKPVEPPLVAAPVAHVELPRVAAPAEHDHDELFRRASTRTSLVLDSPLEASLQADPFRFCGEMLKNPLFSEMVIAVGDRQDTCARTLRPKRKSRRPSWKRTNTMNRIRITTMLNHEGHSSPQRTMTRTTLRQPRRLLVRALFWGGGGCGFRLP